jgi:hypothetical protein
VDNKDAKTITIKISGHEKIHYTAVLECCADGTKLPKMLIFKMKIMTKYKIPRGIVVHIQERWMDENGMKLWLEKVWAKRPGGLLLLCDQFKSHVKEATKKGLKYLNTQLPVVPGLTSQLQPLDVSINKPCKAFMREEWMKWMDMPHHDLTPTGRMK